MVITNPSRSPIGALLGLLLGSLVLPACSDDQRSLRYEPSDRASQEFDAGWAAVEIAPPALLPCLQGKDPDGCAEPPHLPTCLQGPTESGCADLEDWTCPSGWNVDPVGVGQPWEHVACRAPEPPPCSTGEVAPLGESACAPVGLPCPATAFHDEPAIRAMAPNHPGTIWYVAQGASGDGTAASPFGTIAEATASAKPADIIALSVGTFAEQVTINTAVALVGACVLGSSLLGPAENQPALRVSATGARVANLRVSSAGTGIAIQPEAQATTLANIEVEHCIGTGIQIASPYETSLERIVVRDTQADAATQQGGEGLKVEAGTVSLTGAIVERNHSAGIRVSSANASLSANDVLIRDTQPRPSDLNLGIGLFITGGAQVALARALIQRNVTAGVHAYGAGSTLDAQDVVVRETLPSPGNALFGYGIEVVEGATLDGYQCVLDHNTSMGLRTAGSGTTAKLVRAIVSDTLPEAATQYGGNGVHVGGGAYLELSSAIVTRNRSVGVGAWGAGAHAVLTHVVVSQTSSDLADDDWGAGVWAGVGATIVADHAVFESNRKCGVLVDGDGAQAHLSATLVRDNGSVAEAGGDGLGILVSSGGVAELEKTVVAQNWGAALSVRGTKSRVYASDVLIRGPEDPAADNRGKGISATGLTAIELQRVALLGNSSSGISISDGSTLEGGNVLVEGTRSDDDLDVFGNALVVLGGSRADIDNATFRENGTLAVAAAGTGSELHLASTLIRDTEDRYRLVGAPLDAGDHLIFSGTGMLVADFAVATLEGSVVLDNRGAGVAVGDDAVVSMTDIVVRDTTAAECASIPLGEPYSCKKGPLSIGISMAVVAFNRGALHLNRFDLDTAMCGIHIARDGLVSASHGVVHGHAIGLNVFVPDYDLDTVLRPTVRFEDNGTNLEGLTLPLPEIPVYDTSAR